MKIKIDTLLQTNDKILLSKLKKNKSKAFDALFLKYHKQLVYFSFKYLKNIDDAEEVIQDFFTTIWERRNTIDIKISFKAYAYRSVYNNSIKLLKNKQKISDQSEKELDVLKEDYHDYLEEAELADKIHNTIESLPESCKKIFKMSRNDGLKYREIAEELNISIKTVETQISRALKKLYQNLENYINLTIIIYLILRNYL